MKKILMFEMGSCPYCREARRFMKDVLEAHPEYCDIEIEIVDENRERARAMKYDYYYVPTYYVDGEKVHEGVATRALVEAVYRKAFE